MQCQNCGGDIPKGSKACPVCSDSYSRWVESKFKKAVKGGEKPKAPPARPEDVRRRILVGVIVAGGAVLSLTLLCTQPPPPEPPAAVEEDDFEEEEAPPVPAPAPSKPGKKACAPGRAISVDAGLPRLDPILAAMKRDAPSAASLVSRSRLRWTFSRMATPSAGMLERYVRDSDLSLGESVEDFADDELDTAKRKYYGAKCLKDGEWRYLSTPLRAGPEQGVGECWKRQDKTVAIKENRRVRYKRVSKWRELEWSSESRRWDRFSDDQKIEIIESMLDERYGGIRQDEIYEEHIAKLSDPAKRNRVFSILLEAYRPQIEREGLLHRLEHLKCLAEY